MPLPSDPSFGLHIGKKVSAGSAASAGGISTGINPITGEKVSKQTILRKNGRNVQKYYTRSFWRPP